MRHFHFTVWLERGLSHLQVPDREDSQVCLFVESEGRERESTNQSVTLVSADLNSGPESGLSWSLQVGGRPCWCDLGLQVSGCLAPWTSPVLEKGWSEQAAGLFLTETAGPGLGGGGRRHWPQL